MKKCACLVLAVIVMVSCCGCEWMEIAFFAFLVEMGDDRADKEEIVAFVQENRDELLTCIREKDFSAVEDQGIIKSVDAGERVVDFYCGGVGVGSGTAYVGFFYTPDNDMTAVWCASAPGKRLTPLGNGFEWREEFGDNRYYTEKICDCFYYYEASF